MAEKVDKTPIKQNIDIFKEVLDMFEAKVIEGKVVMTLKPEHKLSDVFIFICKEVLDKQRAERENE